MTEAVSPDEIARREEQRIAEFHRQLVDNPIFKDAVGKLRDGCLKLIEDAPLSEPERIKDAQRALKLISRLVQVLSKPIRTGEMATAQLLEIEDAKKKRRLW